MKTAVIGEGEDGHIVYNRSLVALAAHYGFLPRACRPYRAKTTDEVEQTLSARSVLFCSGPRVTA
jgi:transposase